MKTAQEKPAPAPRPETPAGVPSPDTGAPIEEEVGAALGVIAGAAAGAVAGPIGMIVGASLGSVIGEAAAHTLKEEGARRSSHDKELDEAIGVTSGPMGAGHIEGFSEPAGPALFLRADHDDLEALTQKALQQLTEGDDADVGATISELQQRVLAHLDQEERDLLPRYAESAPEDAAALLREHAAFRKALADLDVATDLHLVRVGAVREMLAKLRAHAERENEGLYRWLLAQPAAEA